MSFQLLNNQVTSFQDQLKDAFYGLTSCLCQQQPKIKINGRTFNIVKVLGEGGFSLVYLVQDVESQRQFALKKIVCQMGSEAVKEAMREVEAYRRFRHKNIIRILDSAVVQDSSGEGGKIVYLFLPLYKKGNLQDLINANVVNGTHLTEAEIIKLFKGTCEAVRAMHEFRLPASTIKPSRPPSPTHHDDDEDHDQGLPEPEGDADEGFSYDGGGSSSVPLMNRQRQQAGSPVFGGDDEVGFTGSSTALHEGGGETCPYAHRDIKPGNVMIADDGVTPILMDFGSCMKARVRVNTRSEALLQQDIAAQQSTMAYRAPELFDVSTGAELNEKVDVWSLGCTLFALAYSHSPFENAQTTNQGGSIALAVQTASYKHPSPSQYSQGFRELVDRMLKVDCAERPGIGEVIEGCDRVLRSLS